MISKITCTRAYQLMMSRAMDLARSVRTAAPLVTLVAFVLAPICEQAQAQTQNAPASLQVVLLIDRSGSAQSEDVSMPRVRFARILVDALRAQSWVSGAEIDLAIADFGGTVQLRRPMTRLGTERIEIPLNLAEPIQLTDFQELFREARDLFTPAGNHKRLVIVLTDGIPQLEPKFSLAKSDIPIPVYFGTSEPASPKSVRARLSALAAIGVETFLVVDDANDASTKLYSQEWERILSKGHYLSIGQPGPRFNAARSLFDTIGGGRIEFQQVSPGKPFSLTLSKRYRALGILAIQPSPEAGFEVRSPEGERLPFAFGSPEDRYAFYFDLSPSPGRWPLSAVGKASEFYVWVGREAPETVQPPAIKWSNRPMPKAEGWFLLATVLGLIGSGIWVFLLKRELRAERGKVAALREIEARLTERLGQVEEELARLTQQNSELRAQGSTLGEAQETHRRALKALREGNEEEAAELLQESLGYILDFADQGAELAVRKASEIYSDIERLPSDRQWDLIQWLVTDQQSRDLSRDQIRVISQVLRQRWQKDPALFMSEFYHLQLWSKGDWLIEDLSMYNPSSVAEQDSNSSGALMRQIAVQRKRLNGFVGEI